MKDTTAIIIAIIAIVPTTLAVFLAWRSNKKAIKEVHYIINSRMDALLSSSKAESKAEGLAEGRKELK